ncbi:NRT2 ribosyltransferase, partial [Rhadina sibilatrix]|nr:NRT2 ribosyltransferase [Rhadina sibilatrix]
SDFLRNSQFENQWSNATKEWESKKREPAPLSLEQAIALMAYTTNVTGLYRAFNRAVREAGSSGSKYREEFHFKSLHFLLTRALQRLSGPKDCLKVFRGVRGVQFTAKKGDEIRFGQFTSTSLSRKVAQGYGKDTMFTVRTCHGRDIQGFSYHKSEQEVLIPPFEVFEVIEVDKEKKEIELSSTRNFSNHECQWLKGDTVGTAWGD